MGGAVGRVPGIGRRGTDSRRTSDTSWNIICDNQDKISPLLKDMIYLSTRGRIWQTRKKPSQRKPVFSHWPASQGTRRRGAKPRDIPGTAAAGSTRHARTNFTRQRFGRRYAGASKNYREKLIGYDKAGGQPA
jgi:hypothetical protein